MKYVALIRGILPSNPNMRNANLCRVIEGLGCTNVRAVISSGNVLFSSDETEARLEKKITKALRSELDIPGPTLVRSQTELEQLLSDNPFDEVQHSNNTYLSVTFFASPTQQKPLEERAGIVVKRITTRELCMITDSSVIPGPKTMALLQKTYGKDITTRTWKTLERITSKLRDIEATKNK